MGGEPTAEPAAARMGCAADGAPPAGARGPVADAGAVGHSAEPDDVVVFELDGDGPRVAHERVG